MINNVKNAIADKLKELYPTHVIYDEDVPQNFKTPSFSIELIEQDYNKRLNAKFNSLLSFDVLYFSDKSISEIKEDCLNVQLNLFREFNLIGTYRALNKQATITDQTLHFTFNISYSEIMELLEVKMQQQQTNIDS